MLLVIFLSRRLISFIGDLHGKPDKWIKLQGKKKIFIRETRRRICKNKLQTITSSSIPSTVELRAYSANLQVTPSCAVLSTLLRARMLPIWAQAVGPGEHQEVQQIQGQGLALGSWRTSLLIKASG